MKRIQSLSLFLFGIAFWVSSCAKNNSPKYAPHLSAFEEMKLNNSPYFIEIYQREIWSLVQKSADFTTMLNTMDSFAFAHRQSLLKLEILNASVREFNLRLSDSTTFLKSVMEYLSTNQTKIIPKCYLESTLLHYATLGDYPNMDKVNQYKQRHYLKGFPDEHAFGNHKNTLTTWEHTARYLDGMVKLSSQKLEAGEMLFKKTLLLKQLQMGVIYIETPVYERTAYKKMFAETYKKFPKSSYADDAAFAEVEDCVVRYRGNSLPFVVCECLQKKAKLLTNYPDTDIMDKILMSLIADYSFCHNCDSYYYNSYDDGLAEIIRKTKENIQKGVSCLRRLQKEYPSIPQKKLVSLEQMLKEGEERILWQISVKPNKQTYKMGEPIKLEVAFSWPSDANFKGDVIGYNGLPEISVHLANQRINLISDYEVDSLKSIKTLMPGEIFKEIVTVIPQGSLGQNNKSIEKNFTPGKHECFVSYLFDHYDSYYPRFISQKVEIIVE